MYKKYLFLVMVFALACGTEAFAFGYSTCLGENIKWKSNSKTLRASPIGFPKGYWRDGLRDAIETTNRNPSRFRYSWKMDSGDLRLNNGQSEVWWSNETNLLNGAPAIAYFYWTCYWFFGDHVYMNEVDVAFDVSRLWSADTSKALLIGYSGKRRLFQGTAIHEFSHGLILNHENRIYNIMGSDYSHIHVNGRTAHGYLGEDAANGLVFLYGQGSNSWEDISVVHWKYRGKSGEYSKHTRTKVYNSIGGDLTTLLIDGERGYKVSPGQVVRAEFTYENNGKSLQRDVNVGYYISTNHYISTKDRRIGGTLYQLGRDIVFTETTTLRIPSDLATNANYWIGVIVDEDDSIKEAVEWNNATYIPIRVE